MSLPTVPVLCRTLLMTFMLALPTARASAARWIVDEQASRVGFEYIRAGQPAVGRFKSFHGQAMFDPAMPGAATLTLVIDSASIDLHDPLASAFATSSEWFDSKHYPEVTYRLTDLAPLGGTAYRAEGFLTLRGKTMPVTADINILVEDGSATATGTLVIDRRPYRLGIGLSTAFVEIGPEVEVRFDLRAHPVR